MVFGLLTFSIQIKRRSSPGITKLQHTITQNSECASSFYQKPHSKDKKVVYDQDRIHEYERSKVTTHIIRVGDYEVVSGDASVVLLCRDEVRKKGLILFHTLLANSTLFVSIDAILPQSRVARKKEKERTRQISFFSRVFSQKKERTRQISLGYLLLFAFFFPRASKKNPCRCCP